MLANEFDTWQINTTAQSIRMKPLQKTFARVKQLKIKLITWYEGSKVRISIVIRLNNNGLIGLLGATRYVIAYGSHHRVCLQVWRTKSMFSWSFTMSSISVKAAATFQVFVDVLHYRVSIWGTIVWKMWSQLTDSSCKINTSKVMNYHEHFHLLKTVAYFQPSLLFFYIFFRYYYYYSTANEQVGELKQIIIISNQWSLGLRWIIFNLYHWRCHYRLCNPFTLFYLEVQYLTFLEFKPFTWA